MRDRFYPLVPVIGMPGVKCSNVETNRERTFTLLQFNLT